MRKFVFLLSLVAVCAMAACFFTGCFDEDPLGQERITITIWTIATPGDSFHRPFTEAIDEYNRSQSKYRVVMETFENDQYKAKLPIQVQANQLPDIFYTWAGGFSKSFVDAGKVLPLDEYYEHYRDDLPENCLGAVYDGKLYGVPYVTPVSVVFYNKKAFAEAGIANTPSTFEEWMACCEKLKNVGIIPIGNAAKTGNVWVLAMLHDAITLKSVGPERLSEVLSRKQGSYNSNDFIAGARAFRYIVDKGYMDSEAEEISNDQALAKLYRGESAMYVMGSWMAGLFYDERNCDYPDDFDFFPVPVVNGVRAQLTDFMGGASDTLMVNRESEHAEDAAEIVFELAKAVSRKAYLYGAGTPAWRVDYDTSSVFPLPRKIAETCSGATSFTFWFDTLMVADDTEVYLNNLSRLYGGQITPEEFAESMAAKLGK